jgi:hypothetical protein
MIDSNDYLTTQEVCELLGVEARQVRSLAEHDNITRIAHGVYERTSVERYRAERGTSRTRAWSEHTAWGAIALLSHKATAGLPDTQEYRLRAALRQITDPTELVARLRDRATVTVCAGHRSVFEPVRSALVIPDRTRLGLVDDNSRVDGYIQNSHVGALLRKHDLDDGINAGAVTLRATDEPIARIAQLAEMSSTLAAVDAATSLDPRERTAGEEALARKLDVYRDNTRR